MVKTTFSVDFHHINAIYLMSNGDVVAKKPLKRLSLTTETHTDQLLQSIFFWSKHLVKKITQKTFFASNWIQFLVFGIAVVALVIFFSCTSKKKERVL